MLAEFGGVLRAKEREIMNPPSPGFLASTPNPAFKTTITPP